MTINKKVIQVLLVSPVSYDNYDDKSVRLKPGTVLEYDPESHTATHRGCAFELQAPEFVVLN